MVSVCFNCLIAFIRNNGLFGNAMDELFKMNEEISKDNTYDSFLYVVGVLKRIRDNKTNTSTVELLNRIFHRRNKCSLSGCGCKLP